MSKPSIPAGKECCGHPVHEGDPECFETVCCENFVTACGHDDVEEINDPRKPWGFEAWSCKKCGAKFYIPRGEAI